MNQQQPVEIIRARPVEIIRARPVVAANDNDPPVQRVSDFDRGFEAGWLARVAAELSDD
jgi:hypothetical protein